MTDAERFWNGFAMAVLAIAIMVIVFGCASAPTGCPEPVTLRTSACGREIEFRLTHFTLEYPLPNCVPLVIDSNPCGVTGGLVACVDPDAYGVTWWYSIHDGVVDVREYSPAGTVMCEADGK